MLLVRGLRAWHWPACRGDDAPHSALYAAAGGVGRAQTLVECTWLFCTPLGAHHEQSDQTQELACSVGRTNPGLPLVVLSVAGDLTAAELNTVKALDVQLRFVDEVRFPNIREDGRCGVKGRRNCSASAVPCLYT